MTTRLTPTQSIVLECLATFKFLTISQMMELGLAKSKATLYKALPQLRDKNRSLVKRSTFGFHPKSGKLEDIYYLTLQGARMIEHSGLMSKEAIHYPKGRGKSFSRQYYYRKYTIDTQIAFTNATLRQGFEIELYTRYFDMIGAARNGGMHTAL